MNPVWTTLLFTSDTFFLSLFLTSYTYTESVRNSALSLTFLASTASSKDNRSKGENREGFAKGISAVNDDPLVSQRGQRRAA